MQTNITSVLILDSHDVDNFIHSKILEKHGVTIIVTFTSAKKALKHLQETETHYQLILTDIHFPLMDGFEFVNQFHELNLHQKQGKICILSASLNPDHRTRSAQKNIPFLSKPLIIEELMALYASME